MTTRSAYIVQTCILALGDIPFDVAKDNKIRRAFRTVFRSKNCFTSMRQAIVDLGRSKLQPLPDKPFLRNLGQLVFDTRSLHLSGRAVRGDVAKLLGGRNEYWDPTAKPTRLPKDIRQREVFGYDLTLEDQRMNHLYFELRRPLYMRATYRGQVTADGRVFVHLYPSGYVVIHLAIAFGQRFSQDWLSLREAVLESRPWRLDGQWTWHTRLGTGQLSEVFRKVSDSVCQSLYADQLRFPDPSRWHSALNLATDCSPQQVVDGLGIGEHKVLDFGAYSRLKRDPESGQLTEVTYRKHLVSSDQGILCLIDQKHRRSSILQQFWKIHSLYEFVLLKNLIYEAYFDHLRSEIAALKEHRLSTARKLSGESLRRLSAFDPEIPRYLSALDSHIRNASPFFRRVYAFLSQECGFDSRREKMLELMDLWEDEVALWEHSAVLFWKKIIWPLKSLFGLLL